MAIQQSKIKTDKQFVKLLQDAKAGFATNFDRIQDAILFGLEHYAKPESRADSGYLTRVVKLAVELKGVNSLAVRQYIIEHANLKWDTSGGEQRFKKDKQKSQAEVYMPEDGDFWYNSTLAEDMAERVLMMSDPVAELARVIRRLQSKEREGLIPESRKELFDKFLQDDTVKDILNQKPLSKDELTVKKAANEEGEQEEQPTPEVTAEGEAEPAPKTGTEG